MNPLKTSHKFRRLEATQFLNHLNYGNPEIEHVGTFHLTTDYCSVSTSLSRVNFNEDSKILLAGKYGNPAWSVLHCRFATPQSF